MTRPFFLSVSFGFYRRKARVILSPAALPWARGNTGWRSSTGGRRQGGSSGSKAKGRQSRRKASDHSDKAKRLRCCLCIQKELMKKSKGVFLPVYLWIRTNSLLIFVIHSSSEQIGVQQNSLELLSPHWCCFPVLKITF